MKKVIFAAVLLNVIIYNAQADANANLAVHFCNYTQTPINIPPGSFTAPGRGNWHFKVFVKDHVVDEENESITFSIPGTPDLETQQSPSCVSLQMSHTHGKGGINEFVAPVPYDFKSYVEYRSFLNSCLADTDSDGGSNSHDKSPGTIYSDNGITDSCIITYNFY